MWTPQSRDAYRLIGVISGAGVATVFIVGAYLFAATIDRANASAQHAFGIILVPGCYFAGILGGFLKADRLYDQRQSR